jgi:hypothetical protein
VVVAVASLVIVIVASSSTDVDSAEKLLTKYGRTSHTNWIVALGSAGNRKPSTVTFAARSTQVDCLEVSDSMVDVPPFDVLSRAQHASGAGRPKIPSANPVIVALTA